MRFLSDVLGPYIKAMNALPRIVLGSIFVVWLGLGSSSKVMLAAVLVFFVVFFNAFQGVREVNPNFIANARVLGASRTQVVRNVVLPSALTWIIASLHVAFGFSIIGAIVGEFLGAQKGLGLVIATAQNNFDPDGVFAAMLIIAILALTAEWLISLLEHRLLSWRPPRPDRDRGHLTGGPLPASAFTSTTSPQPRKLRRSTPMFRRKPALALAAAATVATLAGVSACSSSSASSGSGSMPTVTMMVGGIDKQIYLPYQLAQGLGYYKKYGVSMQLSTEQSGGVGAETAMASGQVDMAGAWYVHTIDFQRPTRTSSTWPSCPARPVSGRCATRAPGSPRRPSGRARRSASPTSGPGPTTSPSTWPPGTT